MTSTQSEETSSQNRELQRRLRARHLNMIIIGGAIGTGLSAASGTTISQAGPGGAFIAYVPIGIMVWPAMQSLGEMAAYLSVPGSFQKYGRRYVSESFGFTMDQNCWFNWVVTVATELVAAAPVIHYWFPDVLSIVWSVLFLAILFGLNALSVCVLGEDEFWFATIKIIIVIIFLVFSVGMIFGILGGSSPDFENQTTGDAPLVNGGTRLLVAFVAAGYPLQDTEMVGAAAGGVGDPKRTVPRTIRTIFWHVLLFYIDAIAVIGFLIAYTDPNPLNAAEDNISISLFILVFERAGIAIAAGLMNAVILTSMLSVDDSGMYASTRMLFSLVRQGHAPCYFGKFLGHGVPPHTLVTTTVIGMTGLITPLINDGVAYTFLLTLSVLVGFVTWFGISFSHYRFCKYLEAQNIPLDPLSYRVSFFSASAVLALIMCFFVVVGQALGPIRTGENIFTILTPYLGIPVSVLLWFIHKKVTGSKLINPTTAGMSYE